MNPNFCYTDLFDWRSVVTCCILCNLKCFRELVDPEKTLLAMLEGKVNALPSHIQSVYVQNILKILCIILKNTSTEHAIEVSNYFSFK